MLSPGLGGWGGWQQREGLGLPCVLCPVLSPRAPEAGRGGDLEREDSRWASGLLAMPLAVGPLQGPPGGCAPMGTGMRGCCSLFLVAVGEGRASAESKLPPSPADRSQ